MVPRWNALLSAASSGRTAFKMEMAPTNLKLFILESRYNAKPSLSSVRFIACMIGTKSSYTPSTTLLVDSQHVLHAFWTFFATADLALSDSFIFRQDSCAFTRTAVRFGELGKNFQICKRIPSTCGIYFVSSLAPVQAKASLWQIQCTFSSLLLSCFSYAATPFFWAAITCAPSLTRLIIFRMSSSQLDCPGYTLQLFWH